MEISSKRTHALQLLEATGIWRSNYKPPVVRLLWYLGLDVPPPHFASFASNACLTGCFFGVVWGLVMWLFVWPTYSISATAAAEAALLAGLFFGLAMASYYAYGKYKHELPSWQELGTSPSGT